MVKQPNPQAKKKASCSVSCKCSTSSSGSSGSAISALSEGVCGNDSSGNTTCAGFHVAPEGIAGNAASRPSRNAASASAAASAIARARSSLNCLRSFRRFSRISSEVKSSRPVQHMNQRNRTGKEVGHTHIFLQPASHSSASRAMKAHSLTNLPFQRILASKVSSHPSGQLPKLTASQHPILRGSEGLEPGYH